MKRVNFHLAEPQISRLKKYSKRSGITVSEIIRRSIDEYLDKKERVEGGDKTNEKD